MNEGEPKPNTLESNEKIDLRILVAEDIPEIRMVLEMTLLNRYSSVESVVNGQDLIDKLSSGYNFDFIITDNNMPPGITGLEAIEKIRKMDHLEGIPILMYTTDQDGTLEARARKNKGVSFLSKPANSEELFAEIDRMRSKQL